MRIYRLMGSLKAVDPDSNNILYVNVSDTFMSINDIPNIIENHSSYTSYDGDESIIRVYHIQVENLVNDLENIEHWLSQENSNSKAIPFIKDLRRMVQNDENGVDYLWDISLIIDIDLLDVKSCVEAFNISNPNTNVENSNPIPTYLPNMST